MIDIQKAASKLVEYLNRHGSAVERDLSMDKTDHYKPFYRTAALFIAPTHSYGREVLGGETPTIEQAKEILRLADPYFVKALDEDPYTFEHLWGFIEDAWAPWGDEEGDG